MESIKELLQTADWKAEKHVPVIDAPDSGKKGEDIEVSVTVGKEIAHPNTVEHHINWIELYFKPEGEKFAIEIGRFGFAAHGVSIFTQPLITVKVKAEKSGTFFASSYCNIHGLWRFN